MNHQTWRIDKHIPLAVIVTIIMQTAAIIWFAAKMDLRVNHLEDEAVRADRSNGAIMSELSEVSRRLVRVETLIELKWQKDKQK